MLVHTNKYSSLGLIYGGGGGGGGGEAMLGRLELRLLCGFNQYKLLQNRDNSGLLGTLDIGLYI